VKSFKIEGRLKGPEYVAITTRAYRLAVDEAWRVLHLETGEEGKETGAGGESNQGVKGQEKTKDSETLKALKKKVASTSSSSSSSVRFNGLDEELMRDLRQVFSRGQDEKYDGLSAGFLNGVKHQDLVRGRSPRHRGLFVGTVMGKSPKGVVVQLKGPIKRGDGIVLDRGAPEEQEEGGAVYEVLDSKGRPIGKGEEVQDGTVTLSFGRNAVDYSRINTGDIIWRNKDPALDSRMKSYMDKGDTQILDVYVKVKGREGEPLEIMMSTTPFGEVEEIEEVESRCKYITKAVMRPL
jgi:U32 family peptidase